MDTREIQTWAKDTNNLGVLDKIQAGLEARASAGEPLARFNLAKNFDDAFDAAIDCFPQATFVKLSGHAGAVLARSSCYLLGLSAHPPRANQENDQIEIRGYQKGYHTGQGIGSPSLTVSMNKKDARAFAKAILEACKKG